MVLSPFSVAVAEPALSPSAQVQDWLESGLIVKSEAGWMEGNLAGVTPEGVEARSHNGSISWSFSGGNGSSGRLGALSSGAGGSSGSSEKSRGWDEGRLRAMCRER